MYYFVFSISVIFFIIIMASNIPMPHVSDEELRYYANILRQSGRYQLVSEVSSTPSPPTLSREVLNTPEREYLAEQSSRTDTTSGLGVNSTTLTDRPSLFGQTRRKVSFSGTSTPTARHTLPAAPHVPIHDISPPVPPPPRLSSLSYIDSLHQPLTYSSHRYPSCPHSRVMTRMIVLLSYGGTRPIV